MVYHHKNKVQCTKTSVWGIKKLETGRHNKPCSHFENPMGIAPFLRPYLHTLWQASSGGPCTDIDPCSASETLHATVAYKPTRIYNVL